MVAALGRSVQVGMKPASKNTWHQVWQLAGPDLWACRWILLRGYLFGLVSVGALVLLPWPLKLIIDYVVADHPLPQLSLQILDWLTRRTDFVFHQQHLVLLFASGYVLIALCATFFGAAEKMANAKVRERMVLSMRDKVLQHFQTLSVIQRSRRRGGDLGLHILVDVHHLVRLLSKTFPLVFRHAAVTVFTLTIMYSIEPLLAAAGLAMVVILAVLVSVKGGRLRRSSRLKRAKEGEVAGYTQEFVKGMDTVQALGAEDYIRRRFRAVNRASLQAGIGETAAAVALERSMQIINGLAVALILGGSGILVTRGQLTVGDMTVFVAYMVQLLKPVEKINEMASAVSRGLSRAEHLGELLAQRPIIHDLPGATPLESCRGIIALKEVCFRYPGGQPRPPVLYGIDMRLEAGRMTVLTGPSGSGKSTLLNLILRQQLPTAGEITIDGRSYSQVTLASLRSQFAVMLQHAHLFAGRLRDALWLNNRPPNDSAIWRVLAQVAMDEFVHALPHGLDSQLEEGGANLSGGQQARLSLARALLLDRPILLLDEPLANIDADSQATILAALEQIRRHKTILVISHQPVLMAQADEVLHLEQGRLSRSFPGTPSLSLGAL